MDEPEPGRRSDQAKNIPAEPAKEPSMVADAAAAAAEVIPVRSSTTGQTPAQVLATAPWGEQIAQEPAPEPAPVTAPAGPQQDDVLHADAARRAAADQNVLAQSRRRTRRSFVLACVSAIAGYGFYELLGRAPQDQMQPGPLRDAFRFNAGLARGLFREHALAPTYPLSRAETLRVNGVYGLKKALAPESWRLQVVGAAAGSGHPRYSQDVTAWEYRYTEPENPHQDQGHDTKVDPALLSSVKMAPQAQKNQTQQNEARPARTPRGVEEAGESTSTLRPGTPGLLLTMDDVLKLPRRELVTEFKCIEGWSQIVHWAGVRMADFLEVYPPAATGGREPAYVYMETPDGDYYTSYDLSIMRHPQTLLVTEMMGAPLTQFHGAPLRLHMPTKYGYKQIKRIGLIAYSYKKPDDYWTKLGYDWYAGL